MRRHPAPDATASTGQGSSAIATNAHRTFPGRVLWRLADPRSLRWKIAAGVAAAACAMALGIGILVHRTTEDRSMNIGRATAIDALHSAEAEYRKGQPTHQAPSAPPTYATGDDVPDNLRDQLGSSPGPVTWYDTRKPLHGPLMWAASRIDGTVLAVSVDMGSEQRSLQALDRHMRYAATATLAAVVPLTLLAAELPLRRLQRVATTARRIRHGELDARTKSRGHDEINEISSAVDLMADALQERLQREQHFTADVAHELRTPLTALVTAASLLPASEATDLVRDRVQTLRSLVDDLLEISRLDAGAEQADTQPVPLGDLVTESVHRTGLETRVTVSGHPVAETDPRRLARIVTNLVLNAHHHGAPPVEVTVDATTIVVRDHGPGFPEDLLAHGPQRFRTGAPERGHGHGLGLTITLGQTQIIGARLTLTNTTPCGAAATLKLPHRKG
ncbi:HAMP domain-containing sensor histidine kinase [Streptomyces olivoreticuli]|uniref:sensor histidine kinase n=1 Tax=Streptomyces olivoreticuli TaxID=68246 RepID=UPI002658A54F|nr:HAMP domain-containing sensor histidine kinase [Streptomyces olivoreticuli]WKK24253.1 HAMP domain-containing sensor histidine kinase [Streptomyces olivoreticuli]